MNKNTKFKAEFLDGTGLVLYPTFLDLTGEESWWGLEESNFAGLDAGDSKKIWDESGVCQVKFTRID